MRSTRPRRAQPGDVLRRFVGEPAAACTPAERMAARRALDLPEEASPPTAVDQCLARPLHERRHDPACALAGAVRAALDNDVPAARERRRRGGGRHLRCRVHGALAERAAGERALRARGLCAPPCDPGARERGHDRSGRDPRLRRVDLDAVKGWRCKDDGPPVLGDPTSIFCAATVADLQTARGEGRRQGGRDRSPQERSRPRGSRRAHRGSSSSAGRRPVPGGKLEPTKAQTVKIEVGSSSFNVALARSRSRSTAGSRRRSITPPRSRGSEAT